MSAATALSTTPVMVTGDNSGSGSGSKPTPHTHGAVNMTAVEGRSVDAVGMMVLQWQTTPSELVRRNLGNAIMIALKPLFRRIVSRFSASARGSLSAEDLEQVASIEAFKLFSRFDPKKGVTFEHEVLWAAKNACQQQIEMHSSDVRPSLHMQRSAKGQGTGSYRGRKVEGLTCNVQSRDGARHDRDGYGDRADFDGARDLDDGGSAYSLARPGAVKKIEGNPNPEDQLDDAQTSRRLKIAINRLTPERRRLVIDYFGIGRDGEESLRSIAARLNRARSKLATDLEAALGDLREALSLA